MSSALPVSAPVIQALPSMMATPHSTYDSWIIAVVNVLRSQCRTLFLDTRDGLLTTPSIHAEEIAFNRVEIAACNLVGATPPAELPNPPPIWWIRSIPAELSPLTSTSTAGQIAMFSAQQRKRELYLSAIDTVRLVIITSLGPKIQHTLSPRTLGHIDLSISEILAEVTRLYGRPNPQRLVSLNSAMAPTLTVSDFPSGTASMSNAFARYEIIGEIIGPFRQFALLTAACSSSPLLKDILADYVKLTPRVEEQLFDAAVSYITIRLPSEPLVPPTAPFPSVNSASSASPSAAFTSSDTAHLLARITALEGQLLKNTSSSKSPTPVRLSTPGFCYAHGQGGHLGSQCGGMKVAGSGYTSAHWDATTDKQIGTIPSGQLKRAPRVKVPK
jgi:hypothetical protein